MKTGNIFLCLFAAFCFSTASASILPPNDLHLEDNIGLAGKMTEKKFNAIIDSIIVHYEPIIKRHGAKLQVLRRWKSRTVNAFANQRGTTWTVAMYGGLARRPEVTEDAFALVVCHELGHHLGGYPFKGRSRWASSEGESDHFATQACARLAWKKQVKENAKYAAKVDPFVKKQCNASWKTVNNQNLCYRIAAAGKSLADLFAALRRGTPVPKFNTPDKNVVKQTSYRHPKAQCRLDTYYNGGLCGRDFDDAKIPGKKLSNKNSVKGEKEALAASCHHTLQNDRLGLRPRCWFAPLVK